MSAKWFYTRDDKTKLGPISFAQLQALAKSGQLRTTDMGQQAGLSRWMPAGQIAGLFPLSAASAKEPRHPTKGMVWTTLMIGLVAVVCIGLLVVFWSREKRQTPQGSNDDTTKKQSQNPSEGQPVTVPGLLPGF
jgi:hypothetical protein